MVARAARSTAEEVGVDTIDAVVERREVRHDASPPAAADPSPEPASLGRRIAGRALDLVVLFALYALVGSLVRVTLFPDVDFPVEGPAAGDAGAFLRVVTVVNILLTMAYEVVPTRRWGRTVGKWTVGTRVIEAGTGRTPGWRAAAVRGLVLMGPSFLPVVGLYGPLVVATPLFFDPLRRGFHDRAAGTLVVGAPPRSARG
jgi:uncharacterized RDD family membrane protein YckC